MTMPSLAVSDGRFYTIGTIGLAGSLKMTSPKTPSGAKMLPYRRQGEIDYASLEFDPNERELPPDHMEQSREIREITWLAGRPVH